MKFPALAVVVLSGAVSLVAAACGSSDNSEFPGGTGVDAGNGADDDGSMMIFMGGGDSSISADAFFASDPFPPYCGLGAAPPPPPPVPGGTEMCPDDKNLPGCGCTEAELGKTAACWTGLRKNRDLGVCKDGMTTCVHSTETQNVWGPCTGEVLPAKGAKGAAACTCFSAGQWKIDNLIPCFETYTDSTNKPTGTFAVSTVLGDGGQAACPNETSTPPPPVPGSDWSTDSLKVDCAGHFKLCYTLKAGDYNKPLATDCTLTTACTEGDYPTANAVTKFPNLKAWTTTASLNACSAQFATTGGYGEMTVIGKSIQCDAIDDGMGNAFVFNRVQYCKNSCITNPTTPPAPECANCQQGGSGMFN